MNKLIIEKEKLIHNIEIIRQMAGSVPVIGMLKCNGYGLGLLEFARVLLDHGVTIFGVSSPEEGITLRNAGFTNEIILLTSIAIDEVAEEIVSHHLVATVGSTEAAFALAKAGRNQGVTPKAHIELNTGMGRCGFGVNQLDAIAALKELPLDFCGTFTHFSFSFSEHGADVDKPLHLFLRAVKQLNEKGFPTGVLHAANSCAFLQYPNTHLDAVRVGSAFLGRLPIPNGYGLQPVGTFQSQVIEINHLEKGDNIGYGNTYQVKRPTTTAIVPVGYADGVLVEKSKDAFRFLDRLRYMFHDFFLKPHYAQINGKQVKILGRTGMFNIILDITDLSVKPGDLVTLKANPILVDSLVVREYV